jgi:hypothetical protein
MHILVSGSSGLVGSAFLRFTRDKGDAVTVLRRPGTKYSSENKFGYIGWDPDAGHLDGEGIHRMDAVVHLAGENIAARWTAAQKARIRDSRVNSTRLIAETMAGRPQPPKVLVCASAIGIYGDRRDESLIDESLPGQGFLSETCQAWEDACDPARRKGIRVVNLRIGVVLHPSGGALGKMLLPFKLGLGGVIGDGRQYWSWIHLDDVVGAIWHAISNENVQGPVNATAPHQVTNREFTRALGKVLGRPTIFPMPAFAARLALGEMADSLLLSSAKVVPNRLVSSGYKFQYPDLEPALKNLLG